MDYVLTKSAQEKLEEIFVRKYLLFTDRQNENRHEKRVGVDQKWLDYLAGLDGVKHIRKFSNLGNTLDYLIEEINHNLPFDKFVIRDLGMGKSPNLIIVEHEFATKILALGYLP